MAQDPRAILVWEEFLTDLEFSRIIEFGTYKWGMSIFFFLFCKQKNAEFYTFDNENFHLCRLGRELGIRDCHRQVDIFSIAGQIGSLIEREGITVLYCDNGDKPKEIAVFSKYLKKGDFLVVHDYGTEVKKEDIPKFLKRVYVEHDDNMTAIFRYD